MDQNSVQLGAVNAFWNVKDVKKDQELVIFVRTTSIMPVIRVCLVFTNVMSVNRSMLLYSWIDWINSFCFFFFLVLFCVFMSFFVDYIIFFVICMVLHCFVIDYYFLNEFSDFWWSNAWYWSIIHAQKRVWVVVGCTYTENFPKLCCWQAVLKKIIYELQYLIPSINISENLWMGLNNHCVNFKIPYIWQCEPL